MTVVGVVWNLPKKHQKTSNVGTEKGAPATQLGWGFPAWSHRSVQAMQAVQLWRFRKDPILQLGGRRSFFTTQKGASKSIYSVLIPREEPINYPFFLVIHIAGTAILKWTLPWGRFLPVCCTAAGMDRVQDTCHEKETLFDKPLIWLMFLVPSGYD